MKLAPQDERILDKKALKELIPYTPQHIQRLEDAGNFPKRVSLGPARVGWYLSEVLTWMEERKEERDLGLEPFALANWKTPPKPEGKCNFPD